MRFLVRDIIDHALFPGARIVAGEAGAGNEIRWVNIMEILDMPHSVQRGELLVTTGYGMDDRDRHIGLIAQLSSRGVCGMAIQPGYYIEKIPAYILREADEAHFPVVELPPTLTFSQITHALFERIQFGASGGEPDPAALSRVLQGWLAEDGRDGARQLLWLAPSGVGEQPPLEAFLQAVGRVRAAAQAKLSHAQLNVDGRRALMLAGPADASALSEFSRDGARLLRAIERELGVMLIAGRAEFSQSDDAPAALDGAVRAEGVLRRAEARRGCCSAESAGLIGRLAAMRYSRPDSQGALDRLVAFDSAHDTAFVDTLRAFLNADGAADAARRLFIHRHTLSNRLERITAISGLRLDDPYARLEAMIDLTIHDLFAP